jgi:hypothetical protein
MTLDASGNFMVGATSPLYSTSNRGNITLNGASTAILGLGIAGVATGYLYTDANVVSLGAESTRSMTFAVNGSERARIDSSGNLLVAKTANDDTTAGFRYNAANKYLSLVRDGNPALVVNRLTSDGNVQEFWRSGTVVGSVSVTTTATAYNTSSDYRLKNTIASMTGALAKVALLKPCTYKWNADGSSGEGFIAHELAEVVPQAVTGEKDALDADGNIKPQGIDTSFLVATLTAAIQEQQAIIESLKARLDAANL